MKRILLVKLSSLGDLFHAVPAARALKQKFGCPVDWVTQPEYSSIVECHEDVDRVIAFPRRGGISAWKAFRTELRKESYDLVVDLQGLFKSGIICAMAKADRVVGCSFPREGAQFFWNEAPERSDPNRHALDRITDTLHFLEAPSEPVEYPLNFPEPDQLPECRPVVALAPRSRWAGKDWPLEKFAELAGKLDLDIWILGGPDDRETGDQLIQMAGLDRMHNLCGAFSLLELGGALKHVDVLVSNDSGPMHFATAVGTPVVALFGPTDPARTGPAGSRHTVLRPPPGPEGYPDHRSYKQADGSFVAQIGVDEVLSAVKSWLS